MTVVWLIIWLLSDHPEVTFVPSLNGWAVWLLYRCS